MAVEGLLDEYVAARLLADRNVAVSRFLGGNGKQHLVQNLPRYEHGASFEPWFSLIDLDHDHACPPDQVAALFPDGQHKMCLRVATRSIESWLMADRESLASLLRVSQTAVPTDVENLDHPKLALVGVASGSNSRTIRAQIVPRAGSGRAVGAEYNGVMAEYVRDMWRPEVAANHSESLARCLARLDEKIPQWAV